MWDLELRHHTDVLRFNVYGEGAAGQRCPLGQGELDINSQEPNSGVQWVPLQLADGMTQKVEDLGDLKVRWKYQLLPPYLYGNVQKKQLANLLHAEVRAPAAS